MPHTLIVEDDPDSAETDASSGSEVVMITGHASLDTSMQALRVGASIAEMERKPRRATLDFFSGRREQAAEMLEVSRKTLYDRPREYERGRARCHGPPSAFAGGPTDCTVLAGSILRGSLP